MKTLINKNNPQIRITAPEFKMNESRWYTPDGELSYIKENWTLVEEPAATEFYEVVRKMRTAQRVYFKTRGYDALTESKRLEKLVDKMLEEYGTLNLFNNDNTCK